MVINMENASYEFMLTDSLEKVFPDRRPRGMDRSFPLWGFAGERLSFQLACYMEYEGCEPNRQQIQVRAWTASLSVQVREAALVPATLPAYHGQLDGHYLFGSPCLCPDLLRPLPASGFRLYPCQWRSLWIDFCPSAETGSGEGFIHLQAVRGEEILWEDQVAFRSLGEPLPEQELIHTEWFHADCLANYYRVPVFSEEHWSIMENFVDAAVRHRVNMLLTPVFTPPLDTAEGGERTTVQLVGVTKDGADYSFDFRMLERWIGMCRRKGIRYLEISHLFTQWGAKCAPKIIAVENGTEKQIFGWNTPATGEAYQGFLRQFLPALKELLRREGMLGNTFFHISDEPEYSRKESYSAARGSVRGLLEGCRIIDALSDYELYREGIVEHPVVASDHLKPFIDAGVPDLWTYHCCVQGRLVANRFMAMPSTRNRILGVQLYLYRIRGFLHWGFNFYSSQHSLFPIDPFQVTDAAGGFPSGDPFLVYPGPDGNAMDSIRGMVLSEAMYDLAALCRLEALTDRRFVESLIREEAGGPLTFDQYPLDETFLLRLRSQVNVQIQNRMSPFV